MPSSINDAIKFLETQWSSINDNKIKGIIAEAEFRKFLEKNNVHFIPGGWIMVPGKNTRVEIPSQHKICLIPKEANFSWASLSQELRITPALMSAYNYFRQVGVSAYIVQAKSLSEINFKYPKPSQGSIRAFYPRPYELEFNSISPKGAFISEDFSTVFKNFPKRDGNRGLRCYAQNRINENESPWHDSTLIRDLFWFEYIRYYVQVDYLVSNNDLDLFIISNSGAAYPVELKSKAAVIDASHGDWFGLDIGPFAKLTFFTANSMHTDALYVVQEVNETRNDYKWLGIKFTDLVKSCSWVGQSGGTGMMGGASSTVKVPKAAFSDLLELLPKL